MILLIFLVNFFLIGKIATDTNPTPDIIKESNVSDTSFMLSVRYKKKHICGAVIVTPYWGLTSASCVCEEEHNVKEGLAVRSGSTIRDAGIRHKVIRVVVHKFYNPITRTYDFGLLEVKDKFPEWKNKEIILPKPWTEPKTHDVATIYGWGKSNDASDFSDELQQGSAVILTRLFCKTLPPERQDEVTKDASLFCASNNGAGPCTGDEGDPLMIQYELIGINSWRTACSDSEKPDVYGNVGNYFVRSWIVKYTKKSD